MIPKRTQRVAEEIHKEITAILNRNVIDPSLSRATITHIKVSPDLKHADIYFSVMGDTSDKDKALKGFQRARTFIRKELARRLKLRWTPDLHFYYDDSIEYAVRMSQTLDQLREDREGTTEANRESDPE